MARPGRLTQRIERLLNESRFHEAFAATRVRICAALVLVPAALFAATSLVRVQAAHAQSNQTQAPPPPAAVPPTPEAPQEPAPPTPAPKPKAPAAPQTRPEPLPVAVPAPSPTPSAPGQVALLPIPPVVLVTKVPPIPSATILLDGEVPQALTVPVPQSAPAAKAKAKNREKAGSWTTAEDGEFYGFFQRYGGSPQFTGSWARGHEDAIAKAEKLAHGDFLLYTNREGKTYYIDDPEIVAQMEAFSGATRSVARQNDSLARAQQALARAQARMAEQQKTANVAKPDLQKDLADLNASIAKLQAQKQDSITPQQLADLQGMLGEMQGKLVQMQVGDQLAKMHLDQQLTQRLARLSAEQANNNWNSDLFRDGESLMKSIVNDAMKNGKAKPVD